MTGRLALLMLLGLVVTVLAGPMLAGDAAAAADPSQAREGISWAHPFGTDDLGRDILARVLVATRLTILLALAAVLIAAGLGYALGLAATLSGGRVRKGVMLVLNLWLAFPPIVVALFVTTALFQTTTSAVIAIALAFVPLYARTMLNLAGGIVELDYIHVARMLGVSRRRRLTHHLTPNVSGPLWIQATTGVGEAMVSLSALSFIGLGVQSPNYDWGSLLAEYLDRIFTDPFVVFAPAAAITVVGIMFAFIGEAGALVMDPRRWTTTTDRKKGPPKGLEFRPTAATPSVQGPVTSSTGAAVGEPVLRLDDLRVWFAAPETSSPVVDGVSLQVAAGETVGIVGESGSGKSVTSAALARLVPEPGVVEARRIDLEGVDVMGELTPELRRHLGTRVATVFQNPMSALTPTVRIGKQMVESARFHQDLDKSAAKARALTALEEVGIPRPARVLRLYPHQLSGGMRQRVVIAMGLMTDPGVLIADEPTTALDVTIQKQILQLLSRLQDEHGMGIVFISHDFGVVREVCDRVLVMLDGRVVEQLTIDELDQAQHPYTRTLLDAVPTLDLRDDEVASAMVAAGTDEGRFA